MKICRCEWKAMHDKLDAINAKLDQLVQQSDDETAAVVLAADLQRSTAALKAAIPTT